VLSLIPPVTVVPDAAPTGSAVCGAPGRFAGHRWSRLADRLNRLDRIWVNVGVPQGARHPIGERAGLIGQRGRATTAHDTTAHPAAVSAVAMTPIERLDEILDGIDESPRETSGFEKGRT